MVELNTLLAVVVVVGKVHEWMVAYLSEVIQDAKGFRSAKVRVEKILALLQILFIQSKLGLSKIAENDVLVSIWKLALDLDLLLCSS